jgi:gluconate 2-dehydrogenase gamma chain
VNTARTTRRDFLADVTRTAAAGALAFQLPLLATLASCAGDTKQFVRLTAAEARTMRAFAAQILPSETGSPGAEEARVVNFVDRAFGDPFFADAVPVVRAGLAELDSRGFASMSHDDQVALIRQISNKPFFAQARTMVLIGTFADASYGGNHNGAGLTMIGMDHRPSYAAPFGWYDAQSATAQTTAAR